MSPEAQPHSDRCNVAENAYALTLFRGLANGDGRAYTATTFPRNPWAGCERFIRIARRVGWLTDDIDAAYGVLDVLDADGDIIQDFGVLDSRSFQQIKRRLDLRVESSVETDEERADG